jgi:predicted dehydrogenase
MKSKSKFNIGLIGCGYWGNKLLKIFLKSDDINSITCTDQNYSREIRSNNISIKILPISYSNKILSDQSIDIVFIASPSSTHYAYSMIALKHRKHVFVEKPGVLALAEANKLLKLLYCQIFHIDYTYLFSSEINFLQKLVNNNKLGSIKAYNAFRMGPGKYQPDCDVIWDLGSHDISILYFLFGKPQSVSCKNEYIFKTKNCDNAVIDISYKDFTARINLSWIYPKKTRIISVVGSRGMVCFDDTKKQNSLEYYLFADSTENYQEINNILINTKKNMQKFKSSNQTPLERSYQYFINCIRHQKESISNIRFGIEVTKILEAAVYSGQNKGKKVLFK